MFKVSDKVMRVGSTSPGDAIVYCGAFPQFGRVYVVANCWEIRGMWQCDFVGLPGTMHNGRLVGWACKHFRLLSEIKEENRGNNIQTKPTESVNECDRIHSES